MYGIRLVLAFAGTAFLPYYLGQQALTIPLSLGVIAAALSDIDDRFSLRLRNLLLTYIGFFITASLAEWFFPMPILFGLMLIVVCFVLILLGSLGRRYALISFGCLVISVYSMLGVGVFEHWYQHPLLLLAGAMWYGFLSTLSFLLFPVREVQQHLEQCFQELGQFLHAKANIFDVDMTEDSYQQSLIDLSLANAKVVDSFNTTRVALVTRLKGDRGQRDTRQSLQYYFIAQDIHERTSSAHIDYQRLVKVFQHSDILFRFQRILSLQGKACRDLAQAIHYQQHYQHDRRFKRIFANLKASLAQLHLEHQYNPKCYDAVKINALNALAVNLKEIDAQLQYIAKQSLSISKKNYAKALQKVMQTAYKDQQNTAHDQQIEDDSLVDERLNGWQDIQQRIQRNFNPESILFRHAIRLSILLVVGHTLVQLFQLEHGYWILMTILFVCQPNFNATERRLKLRIYGTLAGIAIGSFILYFIPSTLGLLIFSIISGVLFVQLRAQQYAQATMFITLMAMINFHFADPNVSVALPRAIHTIIGCGLSWLGLMYIWPDWKFRSLPKVLQKTMQSQCDYLHEIIVQYEQGRNNGLPYRIVRRQANNLDAELASLISTLATEPDIDEDYKQNAFKMLCLSHTLLGYISALGAHRELVDNKDVLDILHTTLDDVKGALLFDHSPSLKVQAALNILKQELNQLDEHSSVILQQVSLILHLLPEIWQLKQTLIFEEIDGHVHKTALS
ncbi:YccS family putative transporter [Acinetobacter sp. c1-l78]|uniref:YccS family putative transporter n=1 Tax=Acinetobacter sp. c1-l78 TaxID=3342803 RepID=UPI0035BA1051